ncbi:MAG TPA: hypothetical protein VFR47_09290 [Anaerolineales bacterium]|nr:hypothetical protein [Anaerolineales bacterium]
MTLADQIFDQLIENANHDPDVLGGDASAARIGDSRAAWQRTLAAADWSQAFIEKYGDPEETSRG